MSAEHRQNADVLDDAGGRPHNSSTYRNHGCRCAKCRLDHAALTRRMRRRRRLELHADPSKVVHGSESTYTNHCCRCTECRAAHTAFRRVAKSERGAS